MHDFLVSLMMNLIVAERALLDRPLTAQEVICLTAIQKAKDILLDVPSGMAAHDLADEEAG